MGPVTPDEAARIVAQVAAALHYAHLQGLVHRDIKPANILLDEQGRPHLTDFGLAVREEDLPKERGRLAGTRHYMSPEQVRREAHHIDGRTDIYSLGVVLYELLCGRRLFEAKTVAELEDQILHREAKPPRQIKDSIPAELERICLKALSKRINERYTTGKDMAEDLQRVFGPATGGQAMTSLEKAGLESDSIRLTTLTLNEVCADPQLLTASRIGPYMPQQFVGRGGTGMVYRALNTRTGQDACLKVFYPIPASIQSDVISRAMSRWVRGLAALNHPNVVKPLDFGSFHAQDGASYFVATEFIHGTPLDVWINNPPTGSSGMAARLRIALDITQALQAAHNCTYVDETGFECRGVLHGDIKPANIIVRPNTPAVVVDFMMVDVQRVISRHTISELNARLADTTVFGTRGFMAPEQARDGIVTVKTDIFALGKTLECLFFPSQEVGAIQTGSHNYPEGLIALLGAMMNDDPNLRPPDMATVSRHLAPPSLDENVQFSVYRPSTIRPQVWYTMLAFAHLSQPPANAPENERDPVHEVQRQARQVLGATVEEYRKLTRDSEHPVPGDSELRFVPDVPGIEFNPPSRSFVWAEAVHREVFRLRASPEVDGQTARGRLTVFLGSIILAEVNLGIRVDSHRAESASEQHDMERGRPYRRIFASYSRKDTWVVEQFKKYAAALGDEYVKKHTRLRAGEEWSEHLRQLIEEADVFQLFWSTNSMHSPFVRREWECALSLGRPGFIRPCYWESPLPACPEKQLPPDELRRVHFQRIPGPLPVELGERSLAKSTNMSGLGVEKALGSTDEETTPVTGHAAVGPRATIASLPAAFGEYVADRKIGSGGLGSVYLGHCANDPLQLVAIKVVPASAHAGELLLREGRRIAQLRHPGIVKVVDAGVQEDQVYLVTGFVDGTTLQYRLREHQPTWEETARIVSAVADALHYAHANGVVHRDVKPSNILLTQTNEPILVDFGLATSMSEGVPELGVIVGTPAYMAPEQILGERVDGRADLYSLGVVLYRMLCRRHPFSATNPMELLARVREEEPLPPRQAVPETPRDLESICLKAMAKRVSDRYATGAEFSADLRRFLAGLPVAAAPRSVRPPIVQTQRSLESSAASPKPQHPIAKPAMPWTILILAALVVWTLLAGLLWLIRP
jgi:serine/threonine protein kinase